MKIKALLPALGDAGTFTSVINSQELFSAALLASETGVRPSFPSQPSFPV